MSSSMPKDWVGPAPESFNKFLELPKEVQVIIWEAACEEGRFVTVYTKKRTLPASDSQGHGNLRYFCFKSHDPFPKVMQACHLAREVAQKTYKLAFHTRALFPTVAAVDTGANATIWINPEVDIICPLSKDSKRQRRVLGAQMSDLKITRIALPDGSWDTENHIPLDRWSDFSLPRETGNQLAWMSGSIKEVALYSSKGPIDPRTELDLTTFHYSTSKLPFSQNQARHSQIREFTELMKDFEAEGVEQRAYDAFISKKGMQRNRIKTCPRWLYDFCKTETWERPYLYLMMANL
ncbi:hypothetical protein NHQ30_007601 [Ciborinia camelliae]|nr:hypothetical protein NHQ30_007601 [Ciborinia camelliae]